MEVSGQVHSPAALPPAKDPLGPIAALDAVTVFVKNNCRVMCARGRCPALVPLQVVILSSGHIRSGKEPSGEERIHAIAGNRTPVI
jgi:hypothetical protein